MYILSNFDWFGSIEDLEKWDKLYKDTWDGKDGVEFLGRFAPHNAKYHWTYFWKAKDFNTWINRKQPKPISKRDYKVLTHNVMEYFT